MSSGFAFGAIAVFTVLVLSGGDDYELCFTIPHQVKRQFCDELSSVSNLAFTCVGEITESNQVLTKGNEIYDLPKEIFEHFE